MNVGIIGTGTMGYYHAMAYNKIERELGDNSNIHLIGVADTDKMRVDEIVNKYGCKGYTNYMDLLDSKKENGDKIDAVSICVPTSMHKDVTIAAIQKGIRGILVEKPIANNLKDAIEVVSIARKMGTLLMVGHVERFNPVVTGMKKIIDSGKLGHVVSISAKRVGPLPPRIRDVGIIIDLAVHDIDVISYLYGEGGRSYYPTDIYAIDGNLKGMPGVTLGKIGFEDRASIMMKFNDGRVGIIETNWLTPHKVRKLDIVGFDRVAYLDYTDQTISIHGHEMVEEIKFTKEEPLIRELRHFAGVVNKNEDIMVRGEDGIQALRVALAATESYKTGNVVKLDTILI